MQMQADLLQEARRQAEICNACRYCEGYCSVFPALHRARTFADGDITHLANLCHNCRGCYYACQYTAPHEFDLNLPRALAEVRQDSWKAHAWPRSLADLIDRSGGAIAVLLSLSFALLFALAQGMQPDGGAGFYAYLSHGLMVAIFAPAFVVPLMMMMAVSLHSYWRTTGKPAIHLSHLGAALRSAGQMRNLKGGHGDGCNFEDQDRFSHARRLAHQAVLYGFLLCFASTSSATIMHYGFGLEAPYGLFSLPKLLGLPGGVLLTVGSVVLAWLKTRADRNLGAPKYWGGEMAFVVLLGAVGASGLALFAATGTGAVIWLLALHLGLVLTLFILTPFSKMAHGFYRLAALTIEAAKSQGRDI